MVFRSRTEAGRRLAVALASFAGQDVVVLALPRGGVPVAAEVAAALQAPLDLALVRKIGAPGEEELAIGAVAEVAGGPPVTVRNEQVIAAAGVDEATFADLHARQLAEIGRRRALYLAGRPPAAVAGRVAIVVDDGVATGATTRAALRAVRARNPRRLVLAIPIAAGESLARLRAECDDIVCLEAPDAMGAIGLYYVDFRQVPDEIVVEILRRFPPTQRADD